MSHSLFDESFFAGDMLTEKERHGNVSRVKHRVTTGVYENKSRFASKTIC